MLPVVLLSLHDIVDIILNDARPHFKLAQMV